MHCIFLFRYSVILLALVDHRFRYVNVGTKGRCHDAPVCRRSALAKILEGPTVHHTDGHHQQDCRAAAGSLQPSVPDVQHADVKHAETVRVQECHGKASAENVQQATIVST